MRIGLSPLIARFMRWGKVYEPTWVFGNIMYDIQENEELICKTISSGKKGYIHGFFITASEPNEFSITWISQGSFKQILIKLAGAGSVKDTSPIALNELTPADSNTDICILVKNEGSLNSYYQAGLLIGEL
jgi:hypothetical protein